MPSTTPKKIDRRVLRTRKAIMSAFDKLISDRNVTKITVSAIAREADIDRKTFYLHYKSVDELAARKAEDALERILASLKAEGCGRNTAERVHIILAEVNAILTSNIVVYSNIALRLSNDQALNRLEQAIKPALIHSGFNPEWGSSKKARMQLQFYIAGAISLYSSWLKSDHSQPIESVSSTIEDIILAGSGPSISKDE